MVLQTIYVITVTVTALTLGIICLLVAPRLLRRFVPKYAELPIGTRVEFDTRHSTFFHLTLLQSDVCLPFHCCWSPVHLYRPCGRLYPTTCYTVYNNLPYFANSLLIMEVANPFMHLRWMMGRLRTSKTSLKYAINQSTVTVVFLLFRLVNAVLYWKGTYIALQNDEYYGIELTTIFGHLLGGIIFHLMNVYWFWKIWIGTVKMVKILMGIDKKSI
ncbi:TLC domain-containing protein 4-A-like isoform X3 [Branchiostoma floridae x Branchiostoma japonicum]